MTEGDDQLTGGGDGQTPVHPNDLEGLKHGWVTTQCDISELEAENTRLGRKWALSHNRRPKEVMTLPFLNRLHHRMFGEVWDWAGSNRVRETFFGVDSSQITEMTQNALRDCVAHIGEAGDPEVTRPALTKLHHQLTVVHPFVNGNGRCTRLFVDILSASYQVGHPIWGQHLPDPRSVYLDALRRADIHEIGELYEFMWSGSHG